LTNFRLSPQPEVDLSVFAEFLLYCAAPQPPFQIICNYSVKKVKRSKKRLDRVFWGKAKMHLCPSVLSILA